MTSQSKPAVEPIQRSDRVIRRILLHQLDAIRATVDGVIDGLDPEPLHDLRVATRRTRVALAASKKLLPGPAVDRFAPEFKWLGRVTGPCRDLDVFLFEMEGFRTRLEISAASLDPLRLLVSTQRKKEHQRVCGALRSERFRLLIDGWSDLLENESFGCTGPRNAGRPVIEFAGKRIRKAYRRCFKRGARLADDAPDRAFHRLRIDAKKLRYLLEFFSDLYPQETMQSLIKELKRLQDILGGFNDMVVQRERLAGFKEQLDSSAEARPVTFISIGRLGRAVEARQDEHRRALAERFASFAGAENQRLYRETFR
jgi:CHAD domain-containing protein